MQRSKEVNRLRFTTLLKISMYVVGLPRHRSQRIQLNFYSLKKTKMQLPSTCIFGAENCVRLMMEFGISVNRRPYIRKGRGGESHTYILNWWKLLCAGRWIGAFHLLASSFVHLGALVMITCGWLQFMGCATQQLLLGICHLSLTLLAAAVKVYRRASNYFLQKVCSPKLLKSFNASMLRHEMIG